MRIAAVYEDDRYLGLISLEDINEAFAILTFMQYRSRRSGSGTESGTEGSTESDGSTTACFPRTPRSCGASRRVCADGRAIDR